MIFGRQKKARNSFDLEAVPHLDALYYAAVYMTKDPREAEDLVQETMLKAFRFWDRYKKGTNCKAWLFRILTNTHINRNRGKHREFSYLENVDVESSEEQPISDASAFYKGPEAGYLHDRIHPDVKAAIDSLPEDFRTAVVLADLQDFSYKEIAEIVECPIGTVMSRLHRGRKMLQKKLRSHAIAQGIVQAEPAVSPKTGTEPTSLDAYRQRRVTGTEG
ncbi:MAG: RNA polymerase sigma-70 factor (ECF subfamily) [Myxococcota bacterium]|jgi:RNA polymerase sigma-70 factor (ECF subfamily)